MIGYFVSFFKVFIYIYILIYKYLLYIYIMFTAFLPVRHSKEGGIKMELLAQLNYIRMHYILTSQNSIAMLNCRYAQLHIVLSLLKRCTLLMITVLCSIWPLMFSIHFYMVIFTLVMLCYLV